MSCQRESNMAIERYISYEMSRQQSLMRNEIARPRPLPQIQIQLPPRQPVKQEPAEPLIINCTLVTLGPVIKRNKYPDLPQLPPVDPALKQQVAKIQKSQHHYTQLFSRLTSMLQTLNQRYESNEFDSHSDGTPPPPPIKRGSHNISSSSSESQPDAVKDSSMEQYPQRVRLNDGNFGYVLGPNGTQITANEYGQVFWTNAPVATRCLLAVVFSSDELATHTLTGKPSPAFYGRERPAKMMLDPRKVDDIVACVRSRTGGKERHIRATITTKCADTAKKYKRRANKALKENIVVIDD
ncbi:CG9883 [Drosophila busckii]|uniref:CG9883 n=2 Tax=Drosophila busckii TaxID=30019 RepID=A0A0M4E322_DROBS|nr:CG9883 [Drosophila busckii]ALC40128.1 CG9883 [Drosophila busckii]